MPYWFTYDGEAFEVTALARHQRIADEVRNDPIEDVLEPACFPLHRSIAAVRTDAPASKLRGDRVNDLGSISVPGDVGREELATATRAGV